MTKPDEERFFEALRLNWPRCEDGSLVQVGDVVDVGHLGRMRVNEVKVYRGTSFALNGFWVGGLRIRRANVGREVA